MLAIICGVIALALGMQYSGMIDITTQVRYHLNLVQSKSLPYPSETFVGREWELDELIKFINFSNHDHRIVNIVGPPGIGKTTLAIHLGHRMIPSGVLVHYIDMAEFPDKQVKQILAEKVLESAGIILNKLADFERLKTWARDRYWYNLIILDNCDDTLHYQKEQFLTAIKKIVEASLKVKVLMTGRETVINLDYMKEFKIHELSMTSAYDLLREKVPSDINITAENGERIAVLTGRIPLALKIVTSLLSLSSPLTPESIILELDTDPIKALSHHALSEKDKVNASFNLSYKYLSNHLRVVGSLIAFFPGSFTTEAVIHIHSIIYHGHGMPPVLEALRLLVERSLLEHNIRTDRYHYHRLIREFFLVQNKNIDHVNKLESFLSEFHDYYSYKLYNYALTFNTEHKPSLSFLDVERHNIQFLLENLANKLIKQPEEFLLTINAFAISLDFDFLSRRFAREELLQPLRGGLTHLDSFLRQNMETHDYASVKLDCNYEPILSMTFHRLLCTYESLMHHLAETENQFHGPEAAVRVYGDRKDMMEQIVRRTSSTNTYIDFLKRLAHYYHVLGLKDEEIDCHRRLFDYTGKVLANECKSEKCKYHDVARLYESQGDYSEAADFYERSLQNEQDQSVMQKAEIVYELFKLNKHLHLYEKTAEYLDKLKSMQDEIMASTVSQIFLNNDVVLNIIQLYKQHGLYQNADMLEEKLFESLSAVNATASQDMLMAGAELARKFFHSKNYQKSIKISQYILNLITVENMETGAVKQKVQIVIGRTKFHAGQFSSGLDDLESVFVNPSTDKETHSKLCLYLGVFRPLKHFGSCSPVELHPYTAYCWVWKLLYLVFVPPLKYTNGKYYYFYLRPRTARHLVTSTTTDLLTIYYKINDLNMWNFQFQLNYIKQRVYDYFVDVLEFCFNSDFIRFVINIISILLRLLMCYIIYKIALKSISFVIKLGYYKLLFVVAFFISIPPPILAFMYCMYIHKLTI